MLALAWIQGEIPLYRSRKGLREGFVEMRLISFASSAKRRKGDHSHWRILEMGHPQSLCERLRVLMMKVWGRRANQEILFQEIRCGGQQTPAIYGQADDGPRSQTPSGSCVRLRHNLSCSPWLLKPVTLALRRLGKQERLERPGIRGSMNDFRITTESCQLFECLAVCSGKAHRSVVGGTISVSFFNDGRD